MPTYEYECTHCGHHFEIFQKITDKPLDNCPKCKNKVKRLIGSGIGVIFKKPKSQTPKTDPITCPKAKEGCNACQQP